MADRLALLSNSSHSSSRSSPVPTPPGFSDLPSPPPAANEMSVPLLVRLRDQGLSHVFITVPLHTSYNALTSQVLAAFRELDANNSSGILPQDDIAALEIKWCDDSNQYRRFPLATVITTVNVASLLFFLKGRAGCDVVEVILRSQELPLRYW